MLVNRLPNLYFRFSQGYLQFIVLSSLEPLIVCLILVLWPEAVKKKNSIGRNALVFGGMRVGARHAVPAPPVSNGMPSPKY